MIVIRRRLLIWLFKAYIKKWGKTIILSFVIGFFVFFLLQKTAGKVIEKIPLGKKEVIGIVGVYTLSEIPFFILEEVSQGLTVIGKDGTIMPGIAKSWSIQDGGKTYIFRLKPDIFFSDNTRLTSGDIFYNFSDVQIERPDKYTIVFKLKSPYAPFLAKISKPIFKKNFVGTGNMKIEDIKLNGSFLKSITLSSKKTPYTKTYAMYDTEETVKIAYLLGNVTTAYGLLNTNYKKRSFADFPNTTVGKTINYDNLVTLFYNTQDKILSDKKIRNALSYTIPDSFLAGEKNTAPYPKFFWTYREETVDRKQDLEHAKLLIEASSIASSSAGVMLEIKTLPKHEKTALEIVKEWKKIDINAKVTIVQTLPSIFQIFLGDFILAKDPDQYSLWHSNQENNITSYVNLRIDKLLEDGRKITNNQERKKAYGDFQKYLLDDSPASFLYFPYQYTITRK